MKKIAHIISAFDVFGPEKTTINECLWLKEKGVECQIINIWEELDVPIKKKIEDAGISYVCLSSSGKFDRKVIKALKKQLTTSNVQLVHSHGYKSDTFTKLATRGTRIKTVTTIHGWTSENFKVRLYERLQAFIWRFYDKIYAVSKMYYRTAIQRGVPDSKLDLLYNGIIAKANDSKAVEIDNQKAASAEFGKNRFNVGIVGRLSIEKDHPFFLKIAKESSPHKNIMFKIIGEGPERAKIEAIQDELSLKNNVELLGHIDDMQSVYDDLDVLVICSFREGLPNVLLEAMLNKVPVVSIDVGGVPDVIDGKDKGGIILNEKNARKFSKAIVKLHQDKALHKKIGEQGHQRILQQFTFEIRMQKVFADYQYMIEQSQG